MEQNADRRNSKEEKKPVALRKVVAIIFLGIILLTTLLAVGYFGVKTLHRSHQRREAMAAYERGDYEKAERLLRQYIRKDQNSEPEFVALANIYHTTGDLGLETQMWQMASSLNPLNGEYYEKMLTGAIQSASYGTLHGILGRKNKVGETLSGRELYLYVISSFRSGYPKDGKEAYKKAVENNPEIFHANDLGRMAEFLAKFESLSEGERSDFLLEARASEDPVVRFEALYTIVSIAVSKAAEDDNDAEVEETLKEIIETNSFVGTPLLADFYYSKYRFSDVIEIAAPYLKKIDDPNLCLLYLESCVFMEKPDELRESARNLRRKTGPIAILADYCDILIAYLEDDLAKLTAALRKSGKLISSPLSRFVRLRVAMDQDSFNEILAVTDEIFSNPPFYDLSDRATLICLDYLLEQMRKPENQNDTSQVASLARILSGYLHGNRLITVIILYDQYKKGVAKESDLLTAIEEFPDDLILNQITAEYLIFNGKAEQALPIIAQALENAPGDGKLTSLQMLALDQTGSHDEAEKVFRRLVEQSEFDLTLIAEYFNFCRDYERTADLSSMADKLENASDDKLKPYASFFRAAALLSENEENEEEDEEKTQEALKLLAASPNDDPEFTFYAANRLTEGNMLDEAEAKYKAIRKTYKAPALILVNLSELYHARGDEKQALEAAKEAFDLEKKSMLPAYIYAKRLSEAERYQEAVDVLKFPRHAVTNYREDIIELWTDCMKHVIEKSMADRRFLQAEEQCKHLLVIAPDDEFGKAKLEEVREILLPKKGENAAEDSDDIPAV